MENLQFKIKSPEHSKAIQERLFELEYKWVNGDAEVSCTQKPYIYLTGDVISWSDSKSSDLKSATLDDLYDMEERIKIGVWTVEFKENSIKVGCTEVPNETVLKIAERIKNK